MAKEKKKLCFVIMGFSKKKDPETNRTIDLDETYKKIIKPAVEASNYQCVRADEIIESGIIDRSMYALLYTAELVIADISTYNPNAIYELGIRHALKPFSTIIIKEDEGKNPFDLNHNRIISYKHLGSEISRDEAIKSIRQLKDLISVITTSPIIDSPLYSYIPNITQPELSEKDLKSIIGELHENENTIYSLSEKAKDHVSKKEFSEASLVWKKLGSLVNNEIYYIQQEAFCTYKSEKPNKLQALTNALQIIAQISDQNDSETLGITGAINKNLWGLTNEIGYLNKAIESYKKGWNLHKDYYTGENYAHCLEQKSMYETSKNQQIYLQIESKNTRVEIITLLESSLEDYESNELMWKYATLSNCAFALNDSTLSEKYLNLFFECEPELWQKETFEKSKKEIQQFLAHIN